MALGLDPDAFWHQTPRSLTLVLRGRQQRDRQAQAQAIVAAFLGARADPVEVDRALAQLSDAGHRRMKLDDDQAQLALASMANSLGTISLAEYREQRKGTTG